MSPLRIFLFFLLLSGFFAIELQAQEQIFRHDYSKQKDTFVEIHSLFGAAAQQGTQPYKITIRNNSGKDRTWTVSLSEANSNSLQTRALYRFSVKNGTEIREDILLPVSPSFLSYSYRNVTYRVTCSGLENINQNDGVSINQDFPHLALTKALARRSLSKLTDDVQNKNSSNQFFGHAIDVEALPTNWLAYTSLDGFLIDAESWKQLSAAQTQAILAWVRFGGKLDIFRQDNAGFEELGLVHLAPEKTGSKKLPVSLGQIELLPWANGDLPSSLIKRYQSYPIKNEILEDQYQNSWSLFKEFGSKSSNPFFVFLLLLLFAVLVAPVNLFVFAKKGRRHRLFITTPIISLAACLILIAAIFLMDGVGGHGMRTALVDLQPSRGEMRRYVTQEQVSRTGVVINPGFATDFRYNINPVNLPSSSYNPFSRRSSRSTSFEFIGTKHEGGFFRSRSEQGFALQSAQPTRARVELIQQRDGETPPKLVSSLDVTLSEFLYCDLLGKYWMSPPNTKVSSGGEIPLEPALFAPFSTRLKELSSHFSKTTSSNIVKMRYEKGRFFSVAENAKNLALPTHSGIDWKENHILVTGSVLTKTDAAATNPTSETNE